MLKKINSIQKNLISSFCYQPYPHLQKAQEILKNTKISSKNKTFLKFSSIVPEKQSISFFILNLNQSNNKSALDTLYIKRFQQYLDYYQGNNELNTILIKSLDDEYFSSGTNFKELQKIIQDDRRGLFQHFNLLYKTIIFNASYSKPLIVNVENQIFNSAIPFYILFPFCYVNPNTQGSFNSLENNFIPHGGESYVLNKLPNSIGKYLALTCDSFNAKDMYDLGMIHKIAKIDADQIERLKNFTHSEQMFSLYQECYTNVSKVVLSKKRDEENSIAEFLQRSEKEDPKKVLLDLFYKKQLLEQADIDKRSSYKEEFKSEYEHDFDQKLIENNHLNYEIFLNEHIQTVDPNTLQNSYFMKNIKDIQECFNENSIEKIKENLLKNGSLFCLDTYRKISIKSQELAQITLDLLESTKYSTFGETINREHQYVNSLIRKKSFENLFSQKEIIPKENFVLLEMKQIVDKNSLMPLKEYYQDFPEAFICLMNKQPLFNTNQMQNYEKIVERTLFRLGFDFLHPTFDVEQAKELVVKFYNVQNNLKKRYQQMESIFENPSLQKNSYESKKILIDKFFNEENIQNKINELKKQAQIKKNENEKNLMKQRLQVIQDINYRKNELGSLKKQIIQEYYQMNPFENNEINLNLLEINNSVSDLSQKFKNKINFKELQEKYNSLKNKLKSENLEIVQDSIQIDWDKFSKRKSSVSRNDQIEYNMDFSYWMTENGIPSTEIKYRERLLNELKSFYEQSVRILNDNESQQLYEQIQKQFCQNYPQFEKIEDMGCQWINVIMDFIPQNRISSETKLIIKKQTQPKPNQEFLQQLQNVSEILNQTLQKNIFLQESESINQYILESENIDKNLKEFFIQLESIPKNNLTEAFNNEINQKFKTQLQKILPNQKQNISENIKWCLDQNLRETFLPHVIFSPLHKMLDAIEQAFRKYNKENQNEFIKSLILFNSEISLEQNMINIDNLIMKGFSLYDHLIPNICFEEDMILLKNYIFKQNLSKNLPRLFDQQRMLDQYFEDNLNEEKEKDEEEDDEEEEEIQEYAIQTLFTHKEFQNHINILIPDAEFENDTQQTYNDFHKYMFNFQVKENPDLIEKKKAYFLRMLQWVKSNQELLIKNNMFSEMTPFSILRQFHDQFKTTLSHLSSNNVSGIFNPQSNHKIDLFFPDVIKIQKLFSSIANEGMNGISQQFSKIQQLNVSDKFELNHFVDQSPEEWVDKSIEDLVIQLEQLMEKSLLQNNPCYELIQEEYFELTKPENLKKILLMKLEEEKNFLHSQSQEYQRNKLNGFNFFKRRIIQENFNDKNLDLDDNDQYHIAKVIFASSFALQQYPNARITEKKDTLDLLKEYQQKYWNQIKGVEKQESKQKKEVIYKRPQIQEINQEKYLSDQFEILNKKLQENKLIDISESIVNDINYVNRKLSIYRKTSENY